MATRVTTTLNDGSDAGLRLTLLDSAGNTASAGSISAITYTVTDTAGNVVDDLLDESITPANPVTIPLASTTTAVSGAAQYGQLLVTVSWTYTDANLGAGTVHNDEYLVTINNFINVPAPAA